MKINKCAFALACVMLFTGGCAKKEENIDVNAIKEAIVSEIKLDSPRITDLGENKSEAERYGIPLNKIQAGFAYTNEKSSEKADEIIVLKAKDKNQISEIERALEAEITGLANTWEGTSTEEFDKVQKHILRSKGTYVLLAICDDSKKAEEIFNGFFG